MLGPQCLYDTVVQYVEHWWELLFNVKDFKPHASSTETRVTYNAQNQIRSCLHQNKNGNGYTNLQSKYPYKWEVGVEAAGKGTKEEEKPAISTKVRSNTLNLAQKWRDNQCWWNTKVKYSNHHTPDNSSFSHQLTFPDKGQLHVSAIQSGGMLGLQLDFLGSGGQGLCFLLLL